MKIISWNCNMAFRNKYEKIFDLKPDVLVLQECENEAKLKVALSKLNYNQIIWYGNNQHKGVAVISFNSANIELSKDHNEEFEYILPIKLENHDQKINLFCIWAMPNKTIRRKSYVGQTWQAVQYYTKYLDENSILIGDFNSNAIWDKNRKEGNHSDLVKFLQGKSISSIYHQKLNCTHGDEKHPTLYLLKNKDKPYHLDYCFASEDLISENTKISVGKHKEWIKLSDHMPLIVENICQ